MSLLPILAFVLTVGIALGLGVRLLAIARHTRQLPEAAIGAASLLIGVGGLLDAWAVLAADLDPGAWASLLVALYSTAAGILYLAIWRLFRPGARWAGVLCALAWAGMAAGAAVIAAAGGHLADTSATLREGPARAAYYLALSLRTAGYLWLGLEALAYGLRMRRGVRFGLAEPMLAHRFLLWAGASGCLAVMLVAALLSRLVLGHSLSAVPAGVYLMSILGLGANLAIWCAFFPPAPYQRWVAGRAEAA